MKRKYKKQRIPLTEENVKEALEKTFEDDKNFIGEVIPGVFVIKVDGQQIITGRAGFDLFAEVLEEEMRKEYEGGSIKGKTKGNYKFTQKTIPKKDE